MTRLLSAMHPWLGVAVSAGAVGVLLAACTFPVRFATPAEVQQATNPTPPAQAAAPPAAAGGGGIDQLQADLRRLIAQAAPSVVRVDTGSASGSGLVLDAAGVVVTPASLVAGSNQVTVTTAAGQRYSGTVAATDLAADIAVIRVAGASGLTAATFGDSGSVQLGDVVVVVGNQVPPTGTVSQGIVSSTAGTSTIGSANLTGLIETTAPVAAGTSGSALLNTAGQVIGMTTLGSAGSSGPAVAIPSNQLSAVAQKLLAGGGTTAGTAYLGISAGDATGGGALIHSVVAGGPAAHAGLQPGWIIVRIGGQAVPNAAAIAQILALYTPGRQVGVTVRLPDGSSRTISVTLGTA
ncbi:MAG TPA: trypsin-like peptidase domain-containing protein [Candidatus Dormibacteraeota bacterium]